MSAAQLAPDRRTMLGGSLALASAVAASAAAPAVAAAHPDAALLQLVAGYLAADKRQQQHDQAYEVALSRLAAPPIPDALFFRPEDGGCIFAIPRDVRELERHRRGKEKMPAYANGVADLARWVAAYLADGTMPRNSFPGATDLARAREIAAAHQAWQAAIRQAEDAAGLTAARDDGDREERLMGELMRRIAVTPAITADGLRAKAHAALEDMAGDRAAAWLTSKHVPGLLAETAHADVHPCVNLAVVLSLAVDVARVCAPAPASKAAA